MTESISMVKKVVYRISLWHKHEIRRTFWMPETIETNPWYGAGQSDIGSALDPGRHSHIILAYSISNYYLSLKKLFATCMSHLFTVGNKPNHMTTSYFGHIGYQQQSKQRPRWVHQPSKSWQQFSGMYALFIQFDYRQKGKSINGVY